MFIYKITNKINNKIYIGQVYNKTIQNRFNRHIGEANINSKSYIGRAIAKYGKENFIVEEIDKANSLEELNNKEIYWIKYYNSTDHNIGYNLTPGGDGGNTYLCKTKEELDEIKKKISKSNSGKNNGMSKQIKAYNVNTKEILHFETLGEACKYFNHRQKASFVYHCENTAKYLWRNEWTFAYENNDFNLNLGIYDPSCNKGIKYELLNTINNEKLIFNSRNKLMEYLNYPKGINFKSPIIEFNNYKITKL